MTPGPALVSGTGAGSGHIRPLTCENSLDLENAYGYGYGGSTP
jgi:hypothetical protein